MAVKRILHLGLGAFHRAHQAAYLQHLADLGDHDWEIVATNLRSDGDALLETLARQGGRYTLETISPQGEARYETVTTIKTLLARDPCLTEVVGWAADPATRILSFTVTEGGYCLAANGRLDWTHPALITDRERCRPGPAAAIDGLAPTGDGQSTLYGALTAALRARREAGGGPLTVLCCDNLRHNGERVRALLLEFIAACGDSSLHDWVAAEIPFPASMVDRITPRPTPEVVARVRAALGRDDPAAVGAESWLQWVIEDRFVAGRPALERVGVELVASVEPYEDAKLRILNGSHSGLAWAGALAGLTTIDQVIARPALAAIVAAYVTDDVIPALTRGGLPSPVDLPRYRDSVFERFGNVAIHDTVRRVAADGFAKLPVFIAPTIDERLRDQGSVDATAMLVALFLAFLQRWRIGALPFPYEDQAMDPVVAQSICDAADPVTALCSLPALWGGRAGDPRFAAAVGRAAARVADLSDGGFGGR